MGRLLAQNILRNPKQIVHSLGVSADMKTKK